MQAQPQGADSSRAKTTIEPGASRATGAARQQVYRRLRLSPGVIPLDAIRRQVGRVMRLSAGRFPMTEVILRRWTPATGDTWGYAPELLYLAPGRSDEALAGDTAMPGSVSPWGMPAPRENRPKAPAVTGTPVMRADAGLPAAGLVDRPAAPRKQPVGLSHQPALLRKQPAATTRPMPVGARQPPGRPAGATMDEYGATRSETGPGGAPFSNRAPASAPQDSGTARTQSPATGQPTVAGLTPAQAIAIISPASPASFGVPQVAGSTLAGTGVSPAATDSRIQTDRAPHATALAAEPPATTGMASQPSAVVPAARPGLPGDAGRTGTAQAVLRSAGRMAGPAKATDRPGVISIWGEPIVQRRQSERAFGPPVASPDAPVASVAAAGPVLPARTAGKEPPILSGPAGTRTTASPAAAGLAASTTGNVPTVHARPLAASDHPATTGTDIVLARTAAPEAGQPPGRTDRPPSPVVRADVPATPGPASLPERVTPDGAGQHADEPRRVQAHRLSPVTGPTGARTPLSVHTTLAAPDNESAQRRPNEQVTQDAEHGALPVIAARSAMARLPGAPVSDGAVEEFRRPAGAEGRRLQAAVASKPGALGRSTLPASAGEVADRQPSASRAPDQGFNTPAAPIVAGAFPTRSGQYSVAFPIAGGIPAAPGLPPAPKVSRLVSPRPTGRGHSRDEEAPIEAWSIGSAAQGVIQRQSAGAAAALAAAPASAPAAPAASTPTNASEQGAQTQDLERLARAVYDLIEQRLRLERETRGI